MNDSQQNSTFSFWDKFWLTIVSLIVALVAIIGFTNINLLTPTILMYMAFWVSPMLMLFQYRSLRKTKTFIAWTIVSLLMFIEFFWLRRYQILLHSGYNAANCFKTPISFLLLFAFFRRLAKELYFPELIIPGKYWNYSYQEQRYTNAMDLISFFSYWIAIILTAIY